VRSKCALVQMNFRDDKASNVDRGAEFIREAGRAGAEIICLPELATYVYFCDTINADHLQLAEPVPGPSTEVIASAARDAGSYVIFPLYERVAAGELYNTAVVLDPAGAVVGKYRKNSIPLVDMPAMTGIEKYYFRPGNLGYPVFKTDTGVTIGITICYERHFPEGPRSLALAGADIIFVPTATANGRDIWELELRGHAVANLLWVAGVNRVGRDVGGSPTEFYGASVMVSPTGEVVTQASETQEQVLYAEIDTAVSAQLRDEWGFFRDRRPELYGALTEP
jgi:beta-ureidopropionase